MEIHTDRYGWIDNGIADRADFDLKSHSEYSKEDLRVLWNMTKPQLLKTGCEARYEKFGPIQGKCT